METVVQKMEWQVGYYKVVCGRKYWNPFSVTHEKREDALRLAKSINTQLNTDDWEIKQIDVLAHLPR